MAGTAASDARSLARHAVIAVSAVALLGGGLVVFAANAEISGAVIAAGTAVVESYPKRIQHQDGGTVAAIFVRDDQAVQKGELLLRLDDTSLRATVALAQQQLAEARVEQARLKAELVSATSFVWPEDVNFLDDDHRSTLATIEQQALTSELTARDGRISQLREQIVQLQSQIDGYGVQHDAVSDQMEIIGGELSDLASLSDQKLVLTSKVNELAKEKAAQEGESGRLLAAIAQAKASIAERQFQIDQIQSDFASQSLASLQKARAGEATARQQLIVANEKLARTEIKSPQAGVVHESTIHTVGGVIAPTETIMEVVPVSDILNFDLRIDPNDIDQVQVGQAVRLRLTSFDSRSTPEIAGVVKAVSPDFVQPQNQRPYYSATVTVGPAELSRLPADARLRPGIPAEAFVVTSSRTILSYLIHPIAEQLQLAMRDGS